MSRRRIIIAVLSSFTLVAFSPAAASGAVISRASISSSGTQANGASSYSVISGNGRHVLFGSRATNLVAADQNGVDDVFVHDRKTGRTKRVSVSTTGVEGNAVSGDHAIDISASGRFVAFLSFASNLVKGDTNATADPWSGSDIFVRDRDADRDGRFDERGAVRTVRASVGSRGQEHNGTLFNILSMSADGRHIAFVSDATNLGGGGSALTWHVFVRDRVARRTRAVSVSSTGLRGNASSDYPAVSSSGRFVAFASDADNLVPGDDNGFRDVFLRDRDTDRDGVFDEAGAVHTRRVSVSSAEAEANGYSEAVRISANARYLVFASDATNLVEGDLNGEVDVFARDLRRGTTSLISVTAAGGQPSSSSWTDEGNVVSSSGRFVLFRSDAADVVTGDMNGATDVFQVDRDSDRDGVFDEAGTTRVRRVSVAFDGAEGMGTSTRGTTSGSGRVISFASDAANLVADDDNNARDVFVRVLR